MLPKTFIAWLTINRACNLRCGWCYTKMLGFAKGRDMSLDLTRQSLDLFKGLPMKSVILIGGEPTLHPNFIEIVRMVKNAGLRPLLITNSIKFRDQKFLDAVVEAGIYGITTSLKATSDTQYQKYTGCAAFSDVIEAMQNIRIRCEDSGIFHKLSITVGKNLFENVDEMIEAIIASRTTLFSLDTERPVIINGQTYADGQASAQELAAFLFRIYPKLDDCNVRFNLKISIPFCLFPKDFITELKSKDRILSGCQIFGGHGVIIDPQGRILPCNHFCDNPLGQLGIDCSTSEEYIAFRQRAEIADFYKKVSAYPDQRCVDCDSWLDCGGGCRIHWLEKGADELLPPERR